MGISHPSGGSDENQIDGYGLSVHFQQRAVSTSALHQWSGHGPVICLVSGDQQGDPLLSEQIRWWTPPV